MLSRRVVAELTEQSTVDRVERRCYRRRSQLRPSFLSHRTPEIPSIVHGASVARGRHGAGAAATHATDEAPPQAYFVGSAIFHYLGPAFAVLLFARVDVLGVAWLRIASAALIFAVLAAAVAQAARRSTQAARGCSSPGARCSRS